MITALITIRVHRDAVSAFARVTAANCAERVSHPGVLRAELLRDDADPACFTLIESFETQSAINAYHASSDCKRWHLTVERMIIDSVRSRQTLLTGQGKVSPDPSFAVDGARLAAALTPVIRTPAAGVLDDLPETLPEIGCGENEALTTLAPIVLGGAQRLGAESAFAHMDPPTPWVTWVTSLWNASVNQNLLHPDVAPVARELERHAVGWLVPAFGMNGGHMTPGSTVSNLTALWAARELAGITTVVASAAAHLSVQKSAHLLGLNYLNVPTDDNGRLDRAQIPDSLDDAALVLTAGATSTGAVDPLDIAGRAGWTHVDAAWAGPLRFSERYTSRLAGIDAADSVAVSAHKWLFQPKESGVIMFRDTQSANRAISFGGTYLTVPNVGVLGSHGAIAVPLLATLLAWGRAGVAERIERAMDFANDLWSRLNNDRRVEVFGPQASGVVLWRPRNGDMRAIRSALPEGAVSTTTVDGTNWMRHVAANPMADIDRLWTAVDAALTEGLKV